MSKNDLLKIGKKILFIQPKTSDMKELKSTLSQHNYEIIHWDASNPYQFKQLLLEENPTAILVDISMFQEPMCRSEMVQSIRYHHPTVKVVFLTHAMESYVLEIAKRCCASAYLLKPCKPYEVLVTLELLLDKQEKREETLNNSLSLAYGYSYNMEKKRFFRDNQEILLSKNGKKLIELLVTNRGYTVSFEQILYHIWNKNYSLGSLRSLVHRIHEQTGVSLIENIKGVGYRVKLASI